MNTDNDIMSFKEQQELLTFAYNYYNQFNVINTNYYDSEYINNILGADFPFKYAPCNKSWDLNINKIPNEHKNIIDIVENIRQRIIKKENIIESSEPSLLNSFFQILPPNSATHYHIDSCDDDVYHIRFNAILQKPSDGGIPVYNGIRQECKERQYILCRSGLDFHSCTRVNGNIPRIAISYGFNIPKEQIKNYPSIFHDLI